MRRSSAWKDHERRTAEALGGKRLLRGNDFGGTPCPDIDLPAHPDLKVDCKRYQRFSHHSLLAVVKKLYCAAGGIPVLVTQEPHRQPCVTVELEFFAQLLRDRATVAQWVKRNE